MPKVEQGCQSLHCLLLQALSQPALICASRHIHSRLAMPLAYYITSASTITILCHGVQTWVIIIAPQWIPCHNLLSLYPKSSFPSLTVPFPKQSHNHGAPLSPKAFTSFLFSSRIKSKFLSTAFEAPHKLKLFYISRLTCHFLLTHSECSTQNSLLSSPGSYLGLSPFYCSVLFLQLHLFKFGFTSKG